MLSRCLIPTFSETELPPHEPQPSVSDGVSLKDANAAETTFLMPAMAVTVTASFRDSFSIAGSMDGGKLLATVTAPADSLLVAVCFEPDGRLAGIKLTPIKTACTGLPVDTGLTPKAGWSSKLMLLRMPDYAPLCRAQEIKSVS